ncbi:hypothetical protein [Nonomuraea sp. LPB2021202275-12-8]|uniref:hypothetical protein n=1 Tax=Nonomuraea sp. LPB2021202275-12-8 TaxID=3120159 RepID=UPI00300D0E2C
MMRRILAGAAMAGCMFGFSAIGAAADVGPNTANTGNEILSQWSVIDDVTLGNKVLNDSVKYVNLGNLLNAQNLDLGVLNNEYKTKDHHH